MESTLRFPVLLGVQACAAEAKPYAPGGAFAGFSTRDQHDKPFTYDGGARRGGVSFEMDTGKAANGFLEKQGADYLAKKQTLFIANIHGMPGIARTFAMPKMRRYPHRIILADAEGFLARYPNKDNPLTALTFDEKGVVTSVGFVAKNDAAKAFECAASAIATPSAARERPFHQPTPRPERRQDVLVRTATSPVAFSRVESPEPT